MNSNTKTVGTNKPKTEERKKPSVAKRLGTYLLMGALATGVGAKLGCSDTGDSVKDPSCYTQVDADSGVKKCLSRDETKCDWVFMDVDSGVVSDAAMSDLSDKEVFTTDAGLTDASATAPEKQKVCAPVGVTEAGPETSAPDAEVSQDSALDAGVSDLNDGAVDSVDPCLPEMENVAKVRSTKNVSLDGADCGQTECEGALGIGDLVDFNGAGYVVDSISNGKLEAVSGDYRVVATMPTGGVSTCSVFKLKVEQGDCLSELGGAVYLVSLEQNNVLATGRATLKMSLLSSFAPFAGTKKVMVTEGEAEKTVTLGPEVTVKVSLVKGVGDKAYVALEVNNSDKSETYNEPQGKEVEECCSSNLGPVYFIAESVTDNTNPTCFQLEATLNIDGGTKKVKEGDVVLVNGKKYKVSIQFNEGDTAGTYVSLLDISATQNADNVVGYAETATVNGKTVTFQDLDVNGNGAYAPDAGVPVPMDAATSD